MTGDLMPPHRVGNASEPGYAAPKNLIPKTQLETYIDYVLRHQIVPHEHRRILAPVVTGDGWIPMDAADRGIVVQRLHEQGISAKWEYPDLICIRFKQASEILLDRVPKADRPRLERACAAELRRIQCEAWWYRWFPPYRWYINWGWK